jgi:hypothetical protein
MTNLSIYPEYGRGVRKGEAGSGREGTGRRTGTRDKGRGIREFVVAHSCRDKAAAWMGHRR